MNNINKREKTKHFLDLFAGAGGLSEGFIRAGFTPIAFVEMDEASCFTLKTRTVYHSLHTTGKMDIYRKYLMNEISRDKLYRSVSADLIRSVINKKISDDSIEDIFSEIDHLNNNRKIDLIIGGPPCQAYSIIGRSRDSRSMVGDHRNFLYLLYAKFLQKYKPKYFIFENVPGLLTASDNGVKYIDSIMKLFMKSGYNTDYKILNAFAFGVPQARKRVIIIGKLGDNQTSFPEPDEYPQLKTTINDLFSDLPFINAGEGEIYGIKPKKSRNKYLYLSGIKDDSLPITYHISRKTSDHDREIYRQAVSLWNSSSIRLKYTDLPLKLRTHRNLDSFLDRFKVVAGNLEYSQTLCAHIAKDGHYYIHPDFHQNRTISVREAARLQTFPDDYFFENVSRPALSVAYRQIGNAVPVLFAQRIAEKLRKSW